MIVNLDINHVIHWFNAVRLSEDKDRLLESFWDTQLKSKSWLIKNLSPFLPDRQVNIVIHGGWYGVLASMLFQVYKDKIFNIKSIDIDPATKPIADQLNFIETTAGKFQSIISDMKDYRYNSIPDVVINTSCEHVTDQILKEWIQQIPKESIIICQSNNNKFLEEHIHCSDDLENFKKRCNLDEVLFAGNYPCNGYTRFMIIGKNR